jgi:putative endonuclease
MPWFVYIVRCADASLYTGITNDLAARVAAHSAGKGARYTRARAPVTLVWSRRKQDKSAALREEWRIKQLSRAEKLALVAGAGSRVVRSPRRSARSPQAPGNLAPGGAGSGARRKKRTPSRRAGARARRVGGRR